EADFLADRKAIIHKGRLKYLGTSQFLKSKINSNYILDIGFSGNDLFFRQLISEEVQKHVSKSKNITLTERSDGRMKFELCSSEIARFPDLFDKLESFKDVEDFGVCMPSLEEVFLRIVRDEPGETDKVVSSTETIENTGDEAIPEHFPLLQGKV
ncbi:ATP-binding cassette sub- A member 8, partial [Nowakowskiella sp. JEL0078]